MDKQQGLTKKVTNWIKDSISGFNITQKIHQNIRAVLGFTPDDGEGTELEKKLVHIVDQIIRKGKSPAALFEEEKIGEAFEALVQHFPNEMVDISIHADDGKEEVQTLNLFQSLNQYALAAHTDEHQIMDVKRILGQGTSFFNRKRLQRQISAAKGRIAERTNLFQKIIFTESARIEKSESPRQLRVGGQAVTLDQLIGKQTPQDAEGGPPLSMEPEAEPTQAPVPTPAPQASPEPGEVAPIQAERPSPGSALKSVMAYLPRGWTQPQPRPETPARSTEPDIISWEEMNKPPDSEDEDSLLSLDF